MILTLLVRRNASSGPLHDEDNSATRANASRMSFRRQRLPSSLIGSQDEISHCIMFDLGGAMTTRIVRFSLHDLLLQTSRPCGKTLCSLGSRGVSHRKQFVKWDGRKSDNNIAANTCRNVPTPASAFARVFAQKFKGCTRLDDAITSYLVTTRCANVLGCFGQYISNLTVCAGRKVTPDQCGNACSVRRSHGSTRVQGIRGLSVAYPCTPDIVTWRHEFK